MRVLIDGAAGGTGRAGVEQGDAADRAGMDAAVLGQDAVLDAAGAKTPYEATTLEASVAGTIRSSRPCGGTACVAQW